MLEAESIDPKTILQLRSMLDKAKAAGCEITGCLRELDQGGRRFVYFMTAKGPFDTQFSFHVNNPRYAAEQFCTAFKKTYGVPVNSLA